MIVEQVVPYDEDEFRDSENDMNEIDPQRVESSERRLTK